MFLFQNKLDDNGNPLPHTSPISLWNNSPVTFSSPTSLQISKWRNTTSHPKENVSNYDKIKARLDKKKVCKYLLKLFFIVLKQI